VDDNILKMPDRRKNVDKSNGYTRELSEEDKKYYEYIYHDAPLNRPFPSSKDKSKVIKSSVIWVVVLVTSVVLIGAAFYAMINA